MIENLQTVANCIEFEEISGPLKSGNWIKYTNQGDDKNDGGGCWSYVGEQDMGEQVEKKYFKLYLF